MASLNFLFIKVALCKVTEGSLTPVGSEGL